MLFKLQLFLQIDFHQEHFITEVLFNFYFIPNMIMQCLKSLDLFVFLTFVHTILISWNPNLYLMSFLAMLPITRSMLLQMYVTSHVLFNKLEYPYCKSGSNCPLLESAPNALPQHVTSCDVFLTSNSCSLSHPCHTPISPIIQPKFSSASSAQSISTKLLITLNKGKMLLITCSNSSFVTSSLYAITVFTSTVLHFYVLFSNAFFAFI